MSQDNTTEIDEIVSLMTPLMKDTEKKRLATVLLNKAQSVVDKDNQEIEQELDRIKRWFYLKLTLGYTSVIMLAAIMITSSCIIIFYDNFDSYIVKSAIAALFVDIVGIVALTWKVILKSD